jgi:hypothetical protein
MVFVGASRFPERRRRRVVLPAPFAGEKTLVRGLEGIGLGWWDRGSVWRGERGEVGCTAD